MVNITTIFSEGGTRRFNIKFYDCLSALKVPTLVNWSLTDISGETVINSREWVSVTPASSIDIVLTGDDLLCATEFDEYRLLTVYWTFDTTLGSGFEDYEQYKFKITRVTKKKT